MRLSEAIRLGSMLKSQGFYDLRGEDWSCALGAAYDAYDVLGCGDDALLGLPKEVRVLLDTVHGCPACGSERSWLSRIITHLNDKHRWTREQIADWVEMVERADDSEREKKDLEKLACLETG